VSEPVVQVTDLVKRYGEIEAVRGINFAVTGRGDLRFPRPERRGQVHHDQDPVHPREPLLGVREGRGL